MRLPEGRTAGSLDVIELLDIYWQASSREMDEDHRTRLDQIAMSIVNNVKTGEED